ncbi:MAG TPA: ABC transporter permease [Thermoanaerobacter sp.]|nr:ABC transporter permease [Thermoanaerobacter sp.]
MKQRLKNFLDVVPTDSFGLIIALIVIVTIFSLLNPNYFTMVNLRNILVAASVTGLVAIAETYLIIGLLIDLSVGSVVAFASVFTALLLQRGYDFPLTIIIVLTSGILVGLVNAVAINKVKLEPFIATLATMSIIRGLAYIISDGLPIYIMDNAVLTFGNGTIVGIPIAVLILVLAFIVFGIVLAQTRFGRNIYIIGGNREAARLAGLNPERMTIILYIISGVLSSLGGIILAARMNSGQPAAAVGLEFDAITAAVLGGTAFSGGVGSIFGTVLGLFILQGFNTGLIMVNVPVFWQYVARGLLLLTALTIDYIRKVNREKKLLSQSMKD